MGRSSRTRTIRLTWTCSRRSIRDLDDLSDPKRTTPLCDRRRVGQLEMPPVPETSGIHRTVPAAPPSYSMNGGRTGLPEDVPHTGHSSPQESGIFGCRNRIGIVSWHSSTRMARSFSPFSAACVGIPTMRKTCSRRPRSACGGISTKFPDCGIPEGG